MYLEYLKLNPEYEKTVALRRGSQPVEQAQAAMWLSPSTAATPCTEPPVVVDQLDMHMKYYVS